MVLYHAYCNCLVPELLDEGDRFYELLNAPSAMKVVAIYRLQLTLSKYFLFCCTWTIEGKNEINTDNEQSI
jgi:hypothetical protein